MIGIIGDIHFKDLLGYADYIKDQREGEKEKVLNTIVEYFSDCSDIVLLGDSLNAKNNLSEVIAEFVNFLEKFSGKNLYILSGNHEKKGDGSTAIDFLKEANKPNWFVFTKPEYGVQIGKFKVDFLPYMLKSELEVETDEEGCKKLLKKMSGGDILFAHHAISDTLVNSGLSTNLFKEIVLPQKKLIEKYSLVVGGHIHKPQSTEFVLKTENVGLSTSFTATKKILVAGSVFTEEVGEVDKYVWKVKDDLSIEKVRLPVRGIYRLEDPSEEELSKVPKDSIVKVVITKKSTSIEALSETLKRFDANLIVESYPSNRKKIVHIQEGAFDYGIGNLLKIYAEEKGVSHDKLLRGLSLIT